MSIAVNLSLSLSSNRQLELLEEIVALLHHETSEEEADPRESSSTSQDGCNTRPHTSVTNGPEEESSLVAIPRPPSCPPSVQAKLGSLFRRRVQRKREQAVVEIDPSLYLNAAELALINKTTRALPSLPSHTEITHTDPADAAMSRPISPQLDTFSGEVSIRRPQRTFSTGRRWPVFGANSSSSQGPTSIDVSQYWLREMKSWKLQRWLENKDKECADKTRREVRKRRLDRREAAARAQEVSKRATKAGQAYHKWLQTKWKVELKVSPDKPSSLKQQATLHNHHQTPARQPRLQRQTSRKISQTSPLRIPRTTPKHTPITGKDSASRRLGADLDVIPQETSEKLPAKRKREKGAEDATAGKQQGKAPEDMKSVVRQLRQYRLQENGSGRKHTNTGRQRDNRPPIMQHI